VSRALIGFSLLLLTGCGRAASDEQLRGWLDETHREDEARRKKSAVSETASWTLAVRGNVSGGEANYSWTNITAMAHTHLVTTNPAYTTDVNAQLDYRGVPMTEVLDASGAHEVRGPGGSDITIVAADGFMHSVPLAEVRRFPVMLAIEENGVPLVRKTGGPLLEVFPHTSHPESKALYPEGGAFYVTTLIVGTEPLALAVGGKTLHAREIDGLPEHTVEGKAGFRFRWPSGPETIYGPLLSDVIRAAGAAVRGSDRVLVRRKARTDTPEREVTTLRGEDVLACDIIIGVRYGQAHALIPAGLGGPAVLAFPAACPSAARGQAWPMFVESVDIAGARGDGG
jgi:hypothetical protein